MKKIIINKEEDKIILPNGIFVDGFIILAENMIQYTNVKNETKKENENG